MTKKSLQLGLLVGITGLFTSSLALAEPPAPGKQVESSTTVKVKDDAGERDADRQVPLYPYPTNTIKAPTKNGRSSSFCTAGANAAMILKTSRTTAPPS